VLLTRSGESGEIGVRGDDSDVGVVEDGVGQCLQGSLDTCLEGGRVSSAHVGRRKLVADFYRFGPVVKVIVKVKVKTAIFILKEPFHSVVLRH
jgi:hypothetical protein